jgi:hypothetical protein
MFLRSESQPQTAIKGRLKGESSRRLCCGCQYMALYTATIILRLFFPPKPVDSSKLTARLYGMCGAVRVCECVR